MEGKIPPMRFDYDRYVYYSDSPAAGVVTRPYRDLTKPRGKEGEHRLVVFDDPPMENGEFRTMLNELARTGRHEGLSVMVTLHAIQDLGTTRNPYLKQNTDMMIVPSKYVAKNANPIKNYKLFGENFRDLDRNPDAYNYNIVDNLGNLTIVKR